MLENSTLDTSLSLLLDARSKALTAILSPPTKSSRHHDINAVLQSLGDALSVALKTVATATEVFGAEGNKGGLLLNLLEEIENPSRSETSSTDRIRLLPTLATLPNFALLNRHLPPAILAFTPFLSIDSQKKSLSSVDAAAKIDGWLATAVEKTVKGVVVWISNLKGAAQTLAAVRAGVRKGLEGAGVTGIALKREIEKAIEERLEKVYRDHLGIIVSRVPKCLEELVKALPNSPADSSPSQFVFELDLPFPSTAIQSKSNRNSISSSKVTDPFDIFLIKVKKRVHGRSPLIDNGISELESHARNLRDDLEGWMSTDGDDEESSRLRKEYVHSAKETFDGIYKALAEELELVAEGTSFSLLI